ncbi:MAG: 2-hydroxyacid dehydrogenase [Oscillospiraceae bacterium]|nr:2-hydroxyacid dehydrogenase [Oscillospiraceae bacterium]
MKIAFFDTKPYDKTWTVPLSAQYGYEIKFFEHKLNVDTAALTKGYDVVCAFVNDTLSSDVIDILYNMGVKLIAMRCAGYNNVDFKSAYNKINVVRVPSYSPHSVAEHAAALMLSLNRKIHRAYGRTRDNNFSINGLMGIDLNGKTAGIVGTGKIGQVFLGICKGFGMKTIAYDPYPVDNPDFEYVSLNNLFELSDIISLHCPLTPETKHLVNADRLARMKPEALLINTSRGALVNTHALIEALRASKIGGAGLDVYEEEEEYFFEDFSNEVLIDDDLARLLSFPNVLITSHQGFFTREAMQEIAAVTMKNIHAFENGETLENEVCYRCGTACVKKEGHKRCF